jgi:hypothetical protein
LFVCSFVRLSLFVAHHYISPFNALKQKKNLTFLFHLFDRYERERGKKIG